MGFGSAACKSLANVSGHTGEPAAIKGEIDTVKAACISVVSIRPTTQSLLFLTKTCIDRNAASKAAAIMQNLRAYVHQNKDVMCTADDKNINA